MKMDGKPAGFPLDIGFPPENGKIRYLPRRWTSPKVRPFRPFASSAAEGFFTVLGQEMLTPVMVQPGSPARTKFRRVFSTSGSSGTLGHSSEKIGVLATNIIFVRWYRRLHLDIAILNGDNLYDELYS